MSLTSTATAQRVKPVKPVPTDAVPGFDATRFRLGRLCPRAHDFGGSGMSLRYLSGACRDCQQRPEVKARKAERERTRYQEDPEVRARQRTRHQDPEFRARQRTRYQEDPEVRARQLERQRKRYQDPDARARKRESDRKRSQDPEVRARRNELARKYWQESRQAVLAERARKRSQPDQAEPDRPAPSAAEPAEASALRWDDLVKLGGPKKPPRVLGIEKPVLKPKHYNVIKALRDAGPDGLSLEALTTNSGCGGARMILVRLRESDPDGWGRVIHMPGKRGGGNYRFVFPGSVAA